MLNKIRNIHSYIKVFIEWLDKRGPYNRPWCGLVFMFLILLWIFERKSLNIIVLNNALLGMAGGYLFFLISWFYLVKNKVSNFVSKEHHTPLDLFKEFSHRSFLYGLCWFSLIVTGPILGMFIYLKFAFTGVMDGAIYFNYIIEVFYCVAAVFIICWFSYHVVIRGVSPKEAKAQLSLYLAIGATISFLIVSPIFGIFKTIIAALSIAFSWVNHIIALKENEEQQS